MIKGNDEKECSICLDRVEESQYVILSCKHYFCNKCIIENNALKIDSCPLCRQRIYSVYMKNKTIKLSVPFKRCSKCKQSMGFVFPKCYVSSCTNEPAETIYETRTYNINMTCVRSLGTIIAFPNNVPGCTCCREDLARLCYINSTTTPPSNPTNPTHTNNNVNGIYFHIFPDSSMKGSSLLLLGKDR